MGMIDRIIESVSPGAAVNRTLAKERLAAIKASQDRMAWADERRSELRAMQDQINMAGAQMARLYNVAQPDPTIDPISYMNGNPNDDIMGAIDTARRLVRDSMMNDEAAINARRVKVDGIFGENLAPRPDSLKTAAATKDRIDGNVQGRWYEWAEDPTQIHRSRRHTYSELQFIAGGVKETDGEVLWLEYWNSPTEMKQRGLSIPVQYELLECDWLDWTITRYEYRTGYFRPVIGGVEIDPDSKEPLFFHIFTQDPSRGPSQSRRIPAKFVIHDTYTDRPLQIRGWSPFAPIVTNFQDMKLLNSLGLKRAQVDTTQNAVVEVPDGTLDGEVNLGESGDFHYGSEAQYGTAGTMGSGLYDSYGRSIEYLRSGQVGKMRQGAKLHQLTAQPSQVYEPVYRNGMRRIALATGQSYESISADYSQVSFIAGRLAKGPVNRANRRMQWSWVSTVGSRIWDAFIRAGYIARDMGDNRYWTPGQITPAEVSWVLPTPDSADPKGEAEVLQLLLKIGALEHGDMLQQRGIDPAQHYRKMAKSIGLANEQDIDLLTFIFSGANGNINLDAMKAAADAADQAAKEGTD